MCVFSSSAYTLWPRVEPILRGGGGGGGGGGGRVLPKEITELLRQTDRRTDRQTDSQREFVDLNFSTTALGHFRRNKHF